MRDCVPAAMPQATNEMAPLALLIWLATQRYQRQAGFISSLGNAPGFVEARKR